MNTPKGTVKVLKVAADLTGTLRARDGSVAGSGVSGSESREDGEKGGELHAEGLVDLGCRV